MDGLIELCVQPTLHGTEVLTTHRKATGTRLVQITRYQCSEQWGKHRIAAGLPESPWCAKC